MKINKKLLILLLLLLPIVGGTIYCGGGGSGGSVEDTYVKSVTSSLPDTGQTKCYNNSVEITCPAEGEAFHGQDAQYSSNPMSYTDNGDGTVTDNVTGLMWQKCSAGQADDATCSGTVLYYNWYEASGTYDAANNAATTNVCGSLALGGYSDWRLPTEDDLMTIVNYGTYSLAPAIDTTYFPNTISSLCWSVTTHAGTTDDAWLVHFGDGDVGYINKTDDGYVRCVR